MVKLDMEIGQKAIGKRHEYSEASSPKPFFMNLCERRLVGANKLKFLYILLTCIVLITVSTVIAQGAPTFPIPRIQIGVEPADSPTEVAQSLQILILLTVISLAPAILIMTTSFIRIVIVLSFTRTAIGTNQTPPNQVMIGLALFLTIFTMMPTWSKVNTETLQPLSAVTSSSPLTSKCWPQSYQLLRKE